MARFDKRAGELRKFTTAVLTLTMSEASKQKMSDEETEWFFLEGHRDKDAENPPLLHTTIGPYKFDAPLLFSYSDPIYLWATLPCVMRYLEKSVMVGVYNKLFFAHGGISKIATPQEQQRLFDGMQTGEDGVAASLGSRTVKFIDMNDDHSFTSLPARKHIHKLALNTGASTITGRLYVWEPCLLSRITTVGNHIPYGKKLAVYGHTPQWSGFCMIAEHEGARMIVLDTQFTNRQNNYHALMATDDGAFILKGSWEKKVRYAARSEDPLIGTIVTLDDENTEGGKPADGIFRVVCKIEWRVVDTRMVQPIDDEYIAVRYTAFSDAMKPTTSPDDIDPEKPFITEIMVFTPGNPIPTRGGTAALRGETVEPLSRETPLPLDRPVEKGKRVTIHEPTWVPEELRLVGPLASPPVVFCGDIEASVDFLHGFLMTAVEIAHEIYFIKSPLDSKCRDVIKSNMHTYGYEEHGIDSKSLDLRVQRVYDFTERLKALKIQIGCIGDVVGDPTGKGNIRTVYPWGPSNSPRHVTKTRFIDEFVCIHWAVHQTTPFYCAAGNRDVNKMRFLDEIKGFEKYIKPNNGVPREDEVGELDSKTALAPFTYPSLYQ